MERNTNVTSGTAVPSEGPSERDRNPRKGGRFAKKKEKSKNKEKNKSKNAKKNESTPGADDGTPAAVLNSREYPEGDFRGAIALPGGASEPRTDTEARRDSGIEDDPSRSTGSTPGVERNRRRAEVITIGERRMVAGNKNNIRIIFIIAMDGFCSHSL